MLKRFLGLFERKGDLATPGPSLLDVFGIVGTAAGMAVTPETAMRSPATRQAVLLISQSIAALPIRFYRGAETLTDYAPAAALRRSTALLRDLLADFVLTGDGIAVVVRVDGTARELIRVPPSAVTIERDPATWSTRYRVALADGASRLYEPADVLHLRGLPMADGLRGRGLVHDAREAIGIDLAMMQHEAGLFANGARPGGVLRHPRMVGPEVLKRLRESFASAHAGGANSGKTLILEDGLEWVPQQFNSVDLEFVGLRRLAIADIARAANLSPIMLGDIEKSNYANAETAAQSLLSFTLQPIVELMEDALEAALIPEEDRDLVRIEFDVSDFARADTEKRTAALAKEIETGLSSINEARARLGRSPVAGGDQPRTSVQSQPLGAPAQQDQPA